MSDREFYGEMQQTGPSPNGVISFDGSVVAVPSVCGTCGRDFAEVPTFRVRARLVGSVMKSVAWHENCTEPEIRA